jgi:hypothetical protein
MEQALIEIIITENWRKFVINKILLRIKIKQSKDIRKILYRIGRY